MNASAPAPLRAALFWLAAAMTILFAGVGVYELMAARAAWASAASLSFQRADAGRRLGQLKQEAKAEDATVHRAQAQAKAAAGAASQTADQAKAEDDAKKAAARALAQAFFAKYPQARAMLIAFMTLRMNGDYALRLRAEGLDPDQIDAFAARAAEHIADDIEMSPNGDWSIGQTNLAADAKSIFGDDGVRDWRDARRAMPAQQWAVGLAAAVNAGATPLSSDQVMQLTQALTSSSDAYGEGGAATLPSIDWGSAMGQAKTLMSDAQWQQAQSYLALQAANRQLQALLKGAK